jgi:hypothetical protein
MHVYCIPSYFPGIKNLSSLNDLNNHSGLNDLNSLISSKNLPEFDVSINPTTKMTWSQCGMDYQKSIILFSALFLLETVGAVDSTFIQIQGS